MIFSVYRNGEIDDPDSFTLQLGMLLEHYPEEVIEFVSDPYTGVQSKHDWPPKISEIKKACDAKLAAMARAKEADAWLEKKRKSDGIKALGLLPAPAESRGVTYGEFLELAKQGKTKERPVGRFEKVPG